MHVDECIAVMNLLRYFVNGVSQIFNILRGDPRHADSTILSQINAEFFTQASTLVYVHARKTEHSDLICDMLPVLLGSKIFL